MSAISISRGGMSHEWQIKPYGGMWQTSVETQAAGTEAQFTERWNQTLLKSWQPIRTD